MSSIRPPAASTEQAGECGHEGGGHEKNYIAARYAQAGVSLRYSQNNNLKYEGELKK